MIMQQWIKRENGDVPNVGEKYVIAYRLLDFRSKVRTMNVDIGTAQLDEDGFFIVYQDDKSSAIEWCSVDYYMPQRWII